MESTIKMESTIMTHTERSTCQPSSIPYGSSGDVHPADVSKDDLASKGASAFREVKANVESMIADAGERGQQALNYAGQKGHEAVDNVREVRDTFDRRRRKTRHEAPLRHPRDGPWAGIPVRGNLAPLSRFAELYRCRLCITGELSWVAAWSFGWWAFLSQSLSSCGSSCIDIGVIELAWGWKPRPLCDGRGGTRSGIGRMRARR
jgi:ElaB/YqjD/DUF883 family membrane-anchored ribosome-binding protein